MEHAKRKETTGRRPRFVGQPQAGNEVVVVVEDTRPDAPLMVDSLDVLQRWFAEYWPRPVELDNSAGYPLPLTPGGRGKVERALSWLEQPVVFGPRRRPPMRHR